jgi:GcrA cell cycle regulator
VRNDVDLIAIGQEMRERMKGLPQQLPAPASFEPSVNELMPRKVPAVPAAGAASPAAQARPLVPANATPAASAPALPTPMANQPSTRLSVPAATPAAASTALPAQQAASPLTVKTSP